MRKGTRLGAAAVVVAAGVIGGSVAAVSAHPEHHHHQPAIKYVVLISVDGLHQSDLQWCIANGACPELAKLTTGGLEFRTPTRWFHPTRTRVARR